MIEKKKLWEINLTEKPWNNEPVCIDSYYDSSTLLGRLLQKINIGLFPLFRGFSFRKLYISINYNEETIADIYEGNVYAKKIEFWLIETKFTTNYELKLFV